MKKRTKNLLLAISAVNQHMFEGKYGSPGTVWYEKDLFNEARLYTALGKEDARTVLLIWKRYKETIRLLREIEVEEKI